MLEKVTFIVTFTSFVILQNVTTYALNGDANTTSSVYLGTVDGKSYFADQQLRMNWTEAKTQFCATNMHLATVTTKAQYDLLKASYNNVTFNYVYWTAGRDSLTLTQFAWDNTGEAPSASIINLVSPPILHSCLGMYVYTGGLSFVGYSCAENWHVLCEVIHGSNI